MVHHSGLRRMTMEDLPAVYAIERTSDAVPWGKGLLEDCVRMGYDCWMLVDDAEIRGYGIVSYAAEEAHILKLAVDPKYYRQGLGQKILEYLLRMAKLHGASEVYLEVRQSNTPAIQLYKKFNFVEVGLRKDYYPMDIEGTKREDGLTLTSPLW